MQSDSVELCGSVMGRYEGTTMESLMLINQSIKI